MVGDWKGTSRAKLYNFDLVKLTFWQCYEIVHPSSFTATYSAWGHNFFPKTTISKVRDALGRQYRIIQIIP